MKVRKKQKSTKLRTPDDIVQELEDAIQAVKDDINNAPLTDRRIRGCKHAIQILAIRIIYDKRGINFSDQQIKDIEYENNPSS